MQHTPGPWRISDTSIVAHEVCIAVIEDDGGYEAPGDERKANAKLIAAAPELLKACVAMRRTMYSPDSEESQLADAAMAKAGVVVE